MTGNTRPRGRKVKAPTDWVGKTTVMIRNIPSPYSQKQLIAEISRRGFANTFDFFYLPMDFTKNANAGYAFANFDSVETVAALRREIDGKRLELAPNSQKLVQVVPATLQGYQANFAHFAHSAVLNHHKTEHSPVFLKDGKLVATTRSKRREQPSLRLPAKRTLVVHQVPVTYTHAMLFLELGVYGLGASVEVLHLPSESEHLGTAYVVFNTEQEAAQFVSVLNGAAFTLSPGAPPMRVEKYEPAPRGRRQSPLLATPPQRPTSFEYNTLGDAPKPKEPVHDVGEFSWESFSSPSAPFEPEVLAAYAAMLNAYSTLPSTALHEVVSEAADQTLRELRGPQLDDRFANLGIEVDEAQVTPEARPRGETWSTPLTAPPTAPFDTNSLLPIPGPPADWTPLRLRSTSVPIARTPSTGPKGKPTVSGKPTAKGSPARGPAITPPTTTAGSSQNSSPVRTPRDASLSPDHAEEEGYTPFGLPTLLPSPNTLLLQMKTPKDFSVFEHPFHPSSRI